MIDPHNISILQRLFIVSQIVRDHNGSVDLDNIKPHGARFTIHIPA